MGRRRCTRREGASRRLGRRTRDGARAVGTTGGSARRPPARRFGVCARADAARTTPRRVRALAARSSAALAGVMVDIPKSGRCGVFLQCGRGQCDETRALTFRVRGFPRVERSAPTGRFFPRQVTRRRASPAHAGARTHGFRPHRARARRPTPICPPRTSWSLSPAWRSPPRADTPCARFASAATPRTRDACGRAGRRAWPLDPRLTPAAPR